MKYNLEWMEYKSCIDTHFERHQANSLA